MAFLRRVGKVGISVRFVHSWTAILHPLSVCRCLQSLQSAVTVPIDISVAWRQGTATPQKKSLGTEGPFSKGLMTQAGAPQVQKKKYTCLVLGSLSDARLPRGKALSFAPKVCVPIAEGVDVTPGLPGLCELLVSGGTVAASSRCCSGPMSRYPLDLLPP